MIYIFQLHIRFLLWFSLINFHNLIPFWFWFIITFILRTGFSFLYFVIDFSLRFLWSNFTIEFWTIFIWFQLNNRFPHLHSLFLNKINFFLVFLVCFFLTLSPYGFSWFHLYYLFSFGFPKFCFINCVSRLIFKNKFVHPKFNLHHLSFHFKINLLLLFIIYQL